MKKTAFTAVLTVLAAASVSLAGGFSPDFDGRSGASVPFADALAGGPKPPPPLLSGSPYRNIFETLPSEGFSRAGLLKAAPAAEPGPAEREAEFLFMAAKLETVYSHLQDKQKTHGFSYGTLKADYRARVRAAASEADYRSAIAAFIETFSDPHLQVYFSDDQPARGPARPVVTNTLTEDGILVTRIARFPSRKEDIRPGLEESLALAKTAKALVVDLRGNPGGNDGHAFWYLSRLAAHAVPTGRYTVKISSETLERYDGYLPEDPQRPGWTPWEYGEIAPNTSATFNGPLAVLIDNGCVSSCEGATVAFKFSGIATLYGATTRGSSGYPVEIKLPGDRGSLYVPTWIKLMPDGTPIEDHGIFPDVRTGPREALDRALLDIRAALN